MKKFAMLAFALVATVTTTTIQAKTFWSDFSVSYLNGSNYELGDPDREVWTIEHATGTSWGDSFLFVDRLVSSNGNLETYFEIAPRFKITDFSEGSFVKNLYVATTVEAGASFTKASFGGYGFTNYLLGVGTDLDMPGFKYFKVNLYARSNESYDNNAQVTVVWALPVGPFLLDAFLDYSTSTNKVNGDKVASILLTQIQLKYDIGQHLGLDTKLYVGTEYSLWRNKFGVDGIDEDNINLLIKYHF